VHRAIASEVIDDPPMSTTASTASMGTRRRRPSGARTISAPLSALTRAPPRFTNSVDPYRLMGPLRVRGALVPARGWGQRPSPGGTADGTGTVRTGDRPAPAA